MNHLKVYESIIEKAKFENRIKHNGMYYEDHHIIPKCLGGSDEDHNLVLLKAKEHYLCHRLLTRIYPHNRKIGLAFFYMTHSKNPYLKISLREYEYAKEINGKYVWNRGLTKENDKRLRKQGETRSKNFKEGKIDTSNFGIKTKQGLKNISLSQKGKKKTEEHRRKLSESLKGKPLSEETKLKMRKNSSRGIPQKKIKCPHCGKEGGITMYRWHFDKCKEYGK